MSSEKDCNKISSGLDCNENLQAKFRLYQNIFRQNLYLKNKKTSLNLKNIAFGNKEHTTDSKIKFRLLYNTFRLKVYIVINYLQSKFRLQ